jgi:transposase
MTAVCVVDSSGRQLWRGQWPTDPEQIRRVVTRHGGEDVRVGLETVL